jgi:hypothetical protein
MKFKVFVAALFAAALCTAGVADAQPTRENGTLKKGGVKYYNIDVKGGFAAFAEVHLDNSGTDADIVIFNGTNDNRDPEAAIAIFNGTVGGYEVAALSAVNGTTLVVCIVSESGAKSKFDMYFWLKDAVGVNVGDVGRLAPGMTVTGGGEFDLHGPVAPELEGIQRRLQEISAAKR